MTQGRAVELSALAAYTANYAAAPCSREKQLEKIRAFFLPAKKEQPILGGLLQERAAWFRKYAAGTLTSEDVNTLSAFIDRLEDLGPYIQQELTAYKKKHQLAADITFGEFVRNFDEDGQPVKSIVSTVFRNAARKKTQQATIKK